MGWLKKLWAVLRKRLEKAAKDEIRRELDDK